MPSKALMFAQMADDTATEITGSYQKWTAFLTTAARLYKYPFHEQLLIFAQRPEATACAEYDLWNQKMGRYVRRGSKGIALVDTNGERPRLRYVFDVADTGGRENSRRPTFGTTKRSISRPFRMPLNAGLVSGRRATLRDSLGRLLPSLPMTTGRNTAATSLIPLTARFWRNTTISMSVRRSATLPLSVPLTPSCPAAGLPRRITLNTRIS